ncbi:MAG: phytanoyl-CoA dioxygenase family protein [Planctomycetes bacterium]|nr:phytanoyl-CoA dioxygenase family protein [Planctomycetota bacterium]
MDALAAGIDAPHVLDQATIAAYRRDGFVKVPEAIFAEAIAAYRPEITRLVHDHARNAKPLETRDTYGKAFLQVSNLWETSDVVKEFVSGRRLARIAAELMGVDGVRIYHDQALYKEAGGGVTPWHCDQVYWPLATQHTITAWIPLQAVPIEMGPLAFSVGSQRCRFGRDLTIGDESEALLARTLKDLPIDESPFALGDVSFHSGWTFHRAGANRSTMTREVMTIIYVADGARIGVPRSRSQEMDLQRWMPGAKPGDPVDTRLNPLVYSSRE